MKLELPLYQCHKQVRAAKIIDIESHESNGVGSHTMILTTQDKVFLTDVWKARFNPEVGGYYVMYEDEYTSYSPAQAFEEGYKMVA